MSDDSITKESKAKGDSAQNQEAQAQEAIDQESRDALAQELEDKFGSIDSAAQTAEPDSKSESESESGPESESGSQKDFGPNSEQDKKLGERAEDEAEDKDKDDSAASAAKTLEHLQGDNIRAMMLELGREARKASAILALASAEIKNAALHNMAKIIRAQLGDIITANERDMAAAEASGRPDSFLDRLKLTPDRIKAMAQSLEEIAALKDPIGDVLSETVRPNGLLIQKRRVPLGVIGIIYESRPNVTSDAGALCLKSGNAVILRGGSESLYSTQAIHNALRLGLSAAGMPETAIQIVPTADRSAVGMMLEGLDGMLDVIVPRGGKSLVERVQKEARVPVFAHLEGLCHIYVDREADPALAKNIVVNAKMRRTGICGAVETLLIDKGAVATQLEPLLEALHKAGCEIRGDDKVLEAVKADYLKQATREDWSTEYLDAIISVKIIGGVEDAIDHIATYGSQHTDAIITQNQNTANKFINEVDSAIVLHNASTQFADGGEFGMGAEIGIATGKMHARGPVGVEQLTSFKYVVRGTGQIRPS